MVDVADSLMNWNHRNVDYIEQEIVCVSKKVRRRERVDRRERNSESNGYNYRCITYSMIGKCGKTANNSAPIRDIRLSSIELGCSILVVT